MGIEEIVQSALLGLAALLAVYGAMHAFVKGLGAIIPGEDPVEEFGDMLDEKVAPVIEKIESGVDLLNPKTHGGAGKGAPEDG
jgi:hypothetical protein